MYVYHISVETTPPNGLETSGQMVYRKNWNLGRMIFLEDCNYFCIFQEQQQIDLGSLGSTPLFIVGALAGGGSVTCDK